MSEQSLTESQAVRHEMYSLLSGYWFSQCLYVIAKLEIVDHLLHQKLTADQLAKLCSANSSALTRLMNALSQTGLFKRDAEQRYSNTPHSLTLSSADSNSLKWHALLGGDPLHWQAWGNLLQSIETGECAFEIAHGNNFYSLLQDNPNSKLVFDKVLASSSFLDIEIAKKIDVRPATRVVDLGGGCGSLLAALKQSNPSLDCVLYELPGTTTAGSTNGEQKNSWGVEFGDILDAVPRGANTLILKFVLHNWDDNRALRILKNCHQGMDKDSRLIVIEMLLPEGNTDDHAGHANKHDLNMMVLTGGKERTLNDYKTLFKQANLELSSVIEAGHGLSLLKAKRLGDQ